MTALHCAALYNSPSVADLLLKAGSHPEAEDENLSTPLHLAATTGGKEVVDFLLEAVEKPDSKISLQKVWLYFIVYIYISKLKWLN